MPDVVLTFRSGLQIGLIVRGKLGPNHHPGNMEQHADVILPDGAPIGFYGEANDGSGNRLGLGMQGVTYDYDKMRVERPFYVSADSAVANRVVSTVLLIDVDRKQAAAFLKEWKAMTITPGSFNILGGNCSTHASAAFLGAGLLQNAIPGLDTPDNLYAQITSTLPAARLHSYTGFVGFNRDPRGGFILTIKPYVDNPKVNTPNPGSSGSLNTNARAA